MKKISEQNKYESHLGRNIHIHGLRGILAFFLFCFHVSNSKLPTFSGPAADAINTFSQSMEHGVELFFGISGIVIYNAFQTSRGGLVVLG